MEATQKTTRSSQIPAFGAWNYCSELPITQNFDLAMQARLVNRRCTSKGGDAVLKSPSPPPKPTKKVSRNRVRVSDSGGHTPTTEKVVKAVDEDLYKVPPEILYQKPRRIRKVVMSLRIGCMGLDCIA